MIVIDYIKFVNESGIQNEDRLFRIPQNEFKISNKVMGKSTFAKFGIEITQYLGYENCKDFTGHTFRRSPAKLAISDKFVAGDTNGSMQNANRTYASDSKMNLMTFNNCNVVLNF